MVASLELADDSTYPEEQLMVWAEQVKFGSSSKEPDTVFLKGFQPLATSTIVTGPPVGMRNDYRVEPFPLGVMQQPLNFFFLVSRGRVLLAPIPLDDCSLQTRNRLADVGCLCPQGLTDLFLLLGADPPQGRKAKLFHGLLSCCLIFPQRTIAALRACSDVRALQRPIARPPSDPSRAAASLRCALVGGFLFFMPLFSAIACAFARQKEGKEGGFPNGRA